MKFGVLLQLMDEMRTVWSVKRKTTTQILTLLSLETILDALVDFKMFRVEVAFQL